MLKPPQSRRFAIAGRPRTARSVWTAARLPPLCGACKTEAFPFDSAADETQADSSSMSEEGEKYRVDFSQLQQFLAERKWKLADDETRALMCRVAGRERIPHLTPEAVRIFPCEILDSVDQRWATISGGRFGFRTQRQIWLECGGPCEILEFEKMGRSDKEALANAERTFTNRVGWQNARSWSGNASSLPIGYLPYSCLMCSYGLGLFGLVAAALAWRLGDCNSSI